MEPVGSVGSLASAEVELFGCPEAKRGSKARRAAAAAVLAEAKAAVEAAGGLSAVMGLARKLYASGFHGDAASFAAPL